MSTFSFGLDHVPLRAMPLSIRWFFAEYRRKRRDRLRAANALAEKKRRAANKCPDGTRLCRCCGKEKPVQQFAWNGRRFRSTCCSCYRKLMAWARRRSPWREREQERRLTHRLVRQGKLAKKPCAICGSTKVDAHHTLFDGTGTHVRWLCRQHHIEAHRRSGKRSAWRRRY